MNCGLIYLSGVPFILKAGKAMSSKKADIRIQFKDVPGDIFKCMYQKRPNQTFLRYQMYVLIPKYISVGLNSHAICNRSKAREERVCYTLATFRGHVHEANCKCIMNQPQIIILYCS